MQGNAVGEFGLGSMYLLGDGVPKDYVQAYQWLNLAAAQAFPGADGARDSFTQEMTRISVRPSPRPSPRHRGEGVRQDG